MKHSETVQQLLKEKKGYRNDNLGTGIYSIFDIVDYEVNELGNEDIPNTCQKLYGSKNVNNIIKDHFGDTNVYGMWFGTRENIMDRYISEDDMEIVEYKIPDNALLLSDLGEEGTLFAFTEHPTSLLSRFIYVK